MSTEPRVRHIVNDSGLDDWLAERRRLGQDGRDEVWEGVYYVAPPVHSSHGMLAHRLGAALHAAASPKGLVATGAFNLGDAHDYRIPDTGWTSASIDDSELYVASVEVVVELESPGDETWQKVPFYFARGVQEVWVISPHAREVRLLAAVDRDVDRSDVLGVSKDEVVAALGWA